MEFKINASPNLKMSEITKRLFNRNFHADIQFCVQGRIIHAHSLELIKRSVIFEQQLRNTMHDTKLIPINNCKYESFLEFIRYIYTDECTINDDNFVEILKLATKYKFIKLENQVLRSGYTTKWLLKFFDHCVRDKYEIAQNFIDLHSAMNLNLYLKDELFLSLHPDAVDRLLKFERVPNSVTELQIFTAVAEWIISNCKINQITLAEGRQRWDKLIKRIRFPTLSIEELHECLMKYPGLLSDSDRMSAARQDLFRIIDSTNRLWICICKRREQFICPLETRTFHGAEHKTIFSVSKETILVGLIIGIEKQRKPIEIQISETEDKTGSQKLIFVQNPPDFWVRLIINLGCSLRLKPNIKYTIKIKYLETGRKMTVSCRKEITELIINDPGKTVNFIEASPNMLEMFFKSTTD